MAINTSGEFEREREAPDVSADTERAKFVQEQTDLTERQDQEPDTQIQTSAERKAEMRKRLMGE